MRGIPTQSPASTDQRGRGRRTSCRDGFAPAAPQMA